MTDWQPIETAPKNGDWLWGLCSVDGDASNWLMCIIFWEEWPEEGAPGWYLMAAAEDAKHVFTPTHWMPLPRLPNGVSQR